MTLDFYGVWCLGFIAIRCKLIKPNCFLACPAITLCLEWALLAANVSASGTCLRLPRPISDAPFTADCILKPCRGKGLIFLSSFGWGFNICEEGAKRVTGKLLRASSQRKTLPLKCGRWRYKRSGFACCPEQMVESNHFSVLIHRQITYFLMQWHSQASSTSQVQ